MRIRALPRICFLASLILLLCGVGYVQIATADSPPLEAAMISLDHQLFPFIYLSVAVNRYGEGISTLTKSNFQVTENGVLQTDYFDVVPPQAGGSVRVVDIVFLMDNSGSMIQEQNAVRDNVIEFVNNLAASDIDYALGLCRFGALQNGGNPIIEDNGTLSTDPEYFKNDVWDRNVIDGGHEPGWDALYEAANGFAFRPGSQKVFILITDECVTHPGDTNYGDYSYNDALNALEGRSVTAFALIDLDYTNSIEDYGTIAEATNGQYFDIYSPFDDILDYISSQVANTYRITYKSSKPAFDGIERYVVVTVSYQGDQATCDGTYTPGSAPRIRRTQDTIDLHNQPWAVGTAFTIRAEITDDVTPFVQSATLYYRRTGDANYTSTSMTHSSDIWIGTIPGSAVKTPGLDYYISATDGESTATSPPVDSRTRPHQLAILPNVAPQITHTPVTTAMVNTPVTITAEVVDTTNVLDSIELWYRKVGQLIFKTNGEMTNIGGDTYQDTIPSSYVTEAGVEYCILAYDDLGVGNWHGSFFDPHVITVSGNQARIPVIIIPGIMGSYLCRERSPYIIEWTPDDWVNCLLAIATSLSLRNPDSNLLAYDVAHKQYRGMLEFDLKAAGYSDPFVIGYPVSAFKSSSNPNSPYNAVFKDTPKNWQEGTDFYYFAYDWRKDIKQIALNLDSAIEWIKGKTGATQVDLIAHSMGGVIARHYVNIIDGEDSVRKVILAGVPNYGSTGAYIALKLGCFNALKEGANYCLPGVSGFANNFPSSYELLPSIEYFSMFGYFFEDACGRERPGKLNGDGDLEAAWRDTYINNSDSRITGILTNVQEKLEHALQFQKNLGAAFKTSADVYIFAEQSTYTLRRIKKWESPVTTTTPTQVIAPWISPWWPEWGCGDGRVLTKVGLGIRNSGSGSLHTYSVDSNTAHSALLDKLAVYIVAHILMGNPEDVTHISWISESDGACQLDPYSMICTTNSTKLTVYSQDGKIYLGPEPDGALSSPPGYQYFIWDNTAYAVMPNSNVYDIGLLPGQGSPGSTQTLRTKIEGGDTFNMVVTKYESERATVQYIFENIPISSTWEGTIHYDPSSSEAPVLQVDSDGDGSVDQSIPAKLGNTPRGSSVTLSFYDGQIIVNLAGITSSGHTVCGSVDTLDDLDPSFRPVSPFYLLSTSAEFTGPASITIWYEQSRVPNGREGALKLYRITGEEAIEDITQKLDQAANTVTGQTTGFSYFVVGYLYAAPEEGAFLTDKDSVTIPEGGTATLGVKLSAQPLATTRARVSWISGDSDITVKGNANLTFDRTNWNTYQYVALAAARDADSENGTAVIRIHRIAGDPIPYKDITAIEEDQPGNCVTLPVGWNLMSIPIKPDDPSPEAVFDEVSPLYLYRYNGTDYDSFASGQLTTVKALYGYWLLLSEETEICVSGTALTGDQSLQLGKAGWQMIGVPYPVTWGSPGPPPPPPDTAALDFSTSFSPMVQTPSGSITVTKGTQTTTLAAAVTAGWIYDTIWEYNTTSGKYTSATLSGGKILNPWTGYWILTYENNLKLNFSETGGDSGPPPPPPAGMPRESRVQMSPPPPPVLSMDFLAAGLEFTNIPNPITDVHTTTFMVKGTMSSLVEQIKVQIFDLSGRLVYEEEKTGTSMEWHTENQVGETLANGVYLYRMYALINGTWVESEVKKLVILR